VEIKLTHFGGSKGSGDSPERGAFRLEAIEHSKSVGYADFYREMSGWFVYEVQVVHKRQGIATKLYDYAEDLLGKEIRPQVLDHNVGDPQISKEAFLLWKKRRPDLVEDILEVVIPENRKKLETVLAFKTRVLSRYQIVCDTFTSMP
jgi:hypothetical protein